MLIYERRLSTVAGLQEQKQYYYRGFMASKAPALVWSDLQTDGKRDHYQLIGAP